MKTHDCKRYMKAHDWKRFVFILVMMMLPFVAHGYVGGTFYDVPDNPLKTAHTFLANVLIYTVDILLAIAGIIGLVGALQIYFKMQTGEGEVSKNILMLFGACIFLIVSFYVFPALFGYEFNGSSFSGAGI